ncbi:hypothetical protein, partial [Azospirillum brasilense]|uniref:hypothetical protein n=1 Tax=Azospirillum brasilense TaxID=192 RepID=UPI001A8C99CD
AAGKRKPRYGLMDVLMNRNLPRTGCARQPDSTPMKDNDHAHIMGGCLLLYVTGPGRHSLDALLGWSTTQAATN